MTKALLEFLSRYTPRIEHREILEGVTDYTVRADKESRLLEIRADFPVLVNKNILYAIENEIRAQYALSCVRILPHYPRELFSTQYIPEILAETERVGVVARGFFGEYRTHLSDDELVIDLPLSFGGMSFLDDAKTAGIISGIIRSEFDLSISVKLEHPEDYTSETSAIFRQAIEDLERSAVEASRHYEEMARNAGETYRKDGGNAPDTESDGPQLARVMSVYDEDATPDYSVDGCVCIGHTTFDISSPEYVLGEPFEIRPAQIAAVTHPQKNVTFVGDVICYTADSNRTGDSFRISFGLTDGNATIEARKFNVPPEEAKELAGLFAKGGTYAMRGYVKKDTRKDFATDDLYFFFSDVARVKRVDRMDNAPEKRVELHLHTMMSNMNALIPPDVAVKTANRWGHPAVAITDHGNVQGFQDAMLASEKIGQKVIYGIEAYFVNDTASAVYGNYKGAYGDEFIVFDIETTGLSAQTCRITEIGAVKIKQGKVLDRYNVFVNPETPIPEEIVALTGITDEMVKDADTIDKVLPEFLAFCGDRLLIAHNADFDTGFIRHNANELGIPFENPYLDTVALSRYLNPELKKHKLDVLAEYFGLGDFNHHRACDDAEMLAMIFFKMMEKLEAQDVRTFADLQNEMSTKSDPLKLKPYHMIILIENEIGRKNLYRLISESYLNYFKRTPRIPKTRLEKYREGLIIGSACEAGELMQAIIEGKPESEIEEIARFYDYLEIQPICNNQFLIDLGKIADEEGLRNLNRRVIALGDKLGKPVCATCDAHFLDDSDELYRKILLKGQKFADGDKDVHLYFRTTEEMLEEFNYLGEEKAYEVVVKNTNLIADRIDYENIRPFPKGTFTPNMDGAEEDLQRICWERAKSMYGDPLPEIVSKRLDKELTSIIKNGFAVLYMIAQKLVWYSESQGYLVGSRGSVGSSFVASMAGISEVNPLPPHYWCPNCRYNDFSNPDGVGSGFDLKTANCPKCGTKMNNDGHDIPFETFLGFYGDKSPDIDLNFSGEVQGRVHKYTEELFGAENVFRAGTIGGLADKTAYGYVAKYLEEKGISVNRMEMNRIISHCVGVKRSTGQHPGGIVVVPKEYEIYDFCPVQHPADDPTSNIVTTHFTFEYLHDTLLKLDELGHDMPTKYKWIERFTNTSVMDVPMNDPEVYELFLSTKSLGVAPEDIDAVLGTYGLPEFGTRFVMKMVEEAKPRSFADLLQISGLSHGTDVWTNNAQDLIKEGICDISHVIGCRDNIMNDLIRYGLENALAFKIMEAVRKGKGLTPEWEEEMRKNNVPEWYIGSCKKIKYMFPKAHAAAYVMSAIRLGWYKVHMPIAFYCAMFTVAPHGFDAEIVAKGKSYLVNYIKDIEKRGKEASPKERDMVPSLQLANECFARKIKFLPIDIRKSEAKAFVPENGAIRMPFSALPGLGENAAQNIVNARNEEPFFSIEDMQSRAKLTKAVVEILRRNNVLTGLDETDQLTIFS